MSITMKNMTKKNRPPKSHLENLSKNKFKMLSNQQLKIPNGHIRQYRKTLTDLLVSKTPSFKSLLFQSNLRGQLSQNKPQNPIDLLSNQNLLKPCWNLIGLSSSLNHLLSRAGLSSKLIHRRGILLRHLRKRIVRLLPTGQLLRWRAIGLLPKFRSLHKIRIGQSSSKVLRSPIGQ